MVPQFETDRLILRPLEVADAAQAQRLFPHWEVVKFLLGVPWPYPDDGALRYYVDAALPNMYIGNEWHWSLRLKTEPSQMIGSIALLKGQNNRGFWLGIPWQGKGLMSEACDVVTDFWFDELGFPLLRVPKATANAASRRISEKSGMRVVGVEEKYYVGGCFPTEIWEITAEEWRRHRAKASKASR